MIHEILGWILVACGLGTLFMLGVTLGEWLEWKRWISGKYGHG